MPAQVENFCKDTSFSASILSYPVGICFVERDDLLSFCCVCVFFFFSKSIFFSFRDWKFDDCLPFLLPLLCLLLGPTSLFKVGISGEGERRQ